MRGNTLILREFCLFWGINISVICLLFVAEVGLKLSLNFWKVVTLILSKYLINSAFEVTHQHQHFWEVFLFFFFLVPPHVSSSLVWTTSIYFYYVYRLFSSSGRAPAATQETEAGLETLNALHLSFISRMFPGFSRFISLCQDWWFHFLQRKLHLMSHV